MLFKRHPYRGISLGQMAWRRFRTNVFAMGGLILILMAAAAATLGYLIIPDSSPYANHQQLEIATERPGFSVHLLHVEKNQETAPVSLLGRMLRGKPLSVHTVAIQDWWFEDEFLFYETYAGQEGFEGMVSFVTLPDILYPLRQESPVEIHPDQKGVSFTDMTGKFHVKHVDSLRREVSAHRIQQRRFLLGTDRFGRDMLSQLVIGARVSLSVGLIAVLISLVLGISLGSVSGFFRGRTDDAIVWLINVIWSIPTLLMVIAITFAIGRGFWQVFIAVGLTMWVEVARLVRGQVISIREKEFVEAARALGLRKLRIIRKHILPLTMGPVIVVAAANFASAILIEAGLSFLGIGVQPPMPSWGSMIREHYGFIILDKAYLAIWPGICIMAMVLSFMLVGNGLRDALDNTAASTS